MHKVRWGIIGCGDVTEIKSGPAFQKVAGSQLVAVMRRNGNLASDYAKRHNVPKWYDNADKLINDPDVDAVYIATPPSSHKEYTLAVANAGKPVYVEKPMSLNYNDCLEMVDACKSANVPLFVAYYRRALPKFLKVKELIDNGFIGDVRAVNIRLYKPPPEKDPSGEYNWRTNPAIAGGGYFCDLASHQIDILQYYLGDIISADGIRLNQAKLYEAEDTVAASFLFPNEVIASGLWNFNAHKSIDKTEIIGEEGRIIFPTFEKDPILLETKNDIKKINIDNPKNIQISLIQKIVDDLLGKGSSPSTGETASKTNWVMDKILGN